MKKLITLFAVAALGAALIGCGSGGDTAASGETAGTTATAGTTGTAAATAGTTADAAAK